MTSYQSLEHHEHAAHISHSAHEHGEHDAHGGAQAIADAQATARVAQWTALLVSCLAAGLALCEQGAKHAEIAVQQRAVDTADAWAQYQAKSTRGTLARDVATVATLFDVGNDPAKIAKRDAVVAQLQKEADGYDNDPKDGKRAIAKRAQGLEHDREGAFERTETYHNGSAAFELGIVLATASAITKSRPLFWVAGLLGIGGIVFSLLGWLYPELGAI